MRGRIATNVGREGCHFSEGPLRKLQRAQFQIRAHEGPCAGRRNHGNYRDLRPRRGSERTPARGEPEDDVRSGNRCEEQKVVPARKGLGHDGASPAGKCPHAPCVEVSLEAIERERHPLRREHLQVRVLADAIRRERVAEAADDRHARVACQLADQKIRPEAGQDEGREEQQVVAEHRVPGQRPDGERLHGLREEMLRIRQRIRCGMKDVRVPVAGQGAKVAAQKTPEVIRPPGHDPGVQQRIAEVPRDGRCERRRERPCQQDGGDGVEPGRRGGSSPPGVAAPGDAARRDAGGAHHTSSLVSSSKITCSTAAVGTASSAPTMPSSDPPISRAMMTVTALTPTCRSISFGTSRWFSNCCCTRKKAPTPSAMLGETVRATISAGIAERIGPTIGISSPTPAMNPSTKKYGMPSSQRPSVAVVPMIAPSSSWPPSQALTLIVMSLDTVAIRSRCSIGNRRTNRRKIVSESTSM